MKTKKLYSMKWKVFEVMIICWLVPICLLIGFVGVYMGSNHMDTTAEKCLQELKFNNQICIERINQAVAESRRASYDGDILKLRAAYLDGSITYDDSQKGYQDYLFGHYQKTDLISGAVLYLREQDDVQSGVTYNESAGGSYILLRNYWELDHEDVITFAEDLDTKIGFMNRRNHLYLVRNLVDNHYQMKGTLVLILNINYCLDSLLHNPIVENAVIEFNDGDYLYTGNPISEKRYEKIKEHLKKQSHVWRRGRLYLMDTQKGDTYRITTFIKMNDSIIKYPFYGYPYLVIGMIIAFLLMLASLLYSFKKEVTDPVSSLCEGVERIESGEYGYQIPEKMRNKEFAYLTNEVNGMSLNLQKQIKKIYQEEIALREARIMALQSHINPHFLNNTMEIINWQARMEGNEKVSNMISALSKVLDAAMDRRKLPEINLREEMGYVNAYLYIMKERLGRKLSVEIHMPEELLECPVPRLILQPVIENAIEHGVIPNGEGTVFLNGRNDEEYLYLEIQNDGEFSEKERAHIERLLDMEYNTSKEPSGNLGIANVNQRLRILFGEPCGLCISEKNKKISALLTIPLRNYKK